MTSHHAHHTEPGPKKLADLRNEFSLTGKVALVTGASKGIGEAIARGLAAFGARVVVSSRKQDGVEAVAAGIRAEGGEATAIAAHMGRMEDVRELLKGTVAAYGGIDVIVNNAASNPAFGPIVGNDEGVFDKIFEVNVKGPFVLGKEALPLMDSRGGGSVINIASMAGISPEPMLGLYSVSKAALIHLTKVMAREWGGSKVRANAICPGLIRTKFSQALWQNDEIVKHALASISLGRIGEPDDVVGLAVFLAADASRYCTGGVYTVDGGYTI